MTDHDRLGLAREWLTALEQGDDARADRLLDEIAGIRETQLFHEVGRLTRQLHDTMRSFSLDSRISELTEHDIPDAKERLHYVISMTEQAANQTLTAVEDLCPKAQELNQQVLKLSGNWERFLVRKMPYQEFKGMSHEISGFFNDTQTTLDTIQSSLNEILLAQGFQDITGQIIRRVIALFEDLETSMVELIRLSGSYPQSVGSTPRQDLPGPVVPGIDDKTAGEVANSQDDVDDLLSSLGF